jgi:hypothetical protein
VCVCVCECVCVAFFLGGAGFVSGSSRRFVCVLWVWLGLAVFSLVGCFNFSTA